MKQAPYRIVQIGFNKCATRSLHEFFLANGYRSIHWDEGRAAEVMQENMAAGRPVFDRLDYDFYSDIISPSAAPIFEGHFAFRSIYESYPDGRYILNVRNVDDWIRSRFRHGGGEFAERTRSQRGLPDMAAVEALWRRQWAEHRAAVETFFADKPGRPLLVFDINHDDGETLVRFLPELDLDPALYGRHGETDRELRPRPLVERLRRRIFGAAGR